MTDTNGQPIPVPTCVPVVTPTPVINAPAFVAGTSKVSNGDIVSYNGACFEAKNDPGTWETPSAVYWFWTAVPCEGGVVTQHMKSHLRQ